MHVKRNSSTSDGSACSIPYDKDREFFQQACYNNWFSVNLEKVKQLVLLSSGAIGLLMAMHKDVHGNMFALIFWICSLFCFLIVLAVNLFFSFDWISRLLQKTARDEPVDEYVCKVRLSKNISNWFFIFGIIFCGFFVLSSLGLDVSFKQLEVKSV